MSAEERAAKLHALHADLLGHKLVLQRERQTARARIEELRRRADAARLAGRDDLAGEALSAIGKDEALCTEIAHEIDQLLRTIEDTERAIAATRPSS